MAAGENRPIFEHGKAWFSEVFVIKTDVLYDTSSKAFLNTPIFLVIAKARPEENDEEEKRQFDLGEVVERRMVKEEEYEMDRGLRVSLSFRHLETESITLQRYRRNSSRKRYNKEEVTGKKSSFKSSKSRGERKVDYL